MTQPTAADALGAWASSARSKLEQIRTEHAQAFAGLHYESEDGTVAMTVGPNLELRSCRIRPLESNFRDALKREVARAYNTVMAEAIIERAEAYRNLAKARKNGA